jgi:phosphatidylglycerol---prolipoprotein diacylglyceryl transferase
MDPIAFSLGPLEIRWYGIAMALSMMLGAWIGARLLTKAGRRGELVWDGLVYIILAGVAGARLIYVLTNLSDYTSLPWWHVFAVWEGGLSFHGGIIGGGLATWWYFKRTGIPFLEVADAFAPGVCVGIMVVRLGNLMNGDILGYRWAGPWAMNFPHDEYHFGLPPGTVVPRHPTEIYGFLVGLICSLFTFWVWRNTYAWRKFPIGSTLMAFIISYSFVRSVIEEPFRAVPLAMKVSDPMEVGYGLFTSTQVASLPLILIAIWILFQLRAWEALRATPSPGGGTAHLTRQQRRAQERAEKRKDQ